MTSALLALALAGAAEPPSATSPDPPAASAGWFAGPFSLSFENDSLPLAGGDESYTQGLELHATLQEAGLPQPLRALRQATRGPLRLLRGGRDFAEGTSLFLGQTLFTPQNIVTYEPRQDDRPFVGFLYAGVSSVLQADWAEDEGKMLHPRRFTGQLNVGVTGYDAALGRSIQGAFHVLRESRIPKGWYTQSGNRPEVNALFIREDIVSPYSLHEHADLTLVGQAALGTAQTFASGGAVLRLGWGLTGFPPLSIPRSVDRQAPPRIEVAVFAGVEAKAFGWNRLADQGGEGRPSFVPFVYEWRLGAMVRLKNGLSVSYAVRRRSQEIEPLAEGLLARHWIGALQIAKSQSTSATSSLGFLKGVRMNFGLGRGRSSTEPGLPADPGLSLAGHWGFEKSVAADRFAVALETTGLAREHGRGDGTSHEDTFLLATVATLGVDLLPGPAGRHRLQLRGGGGRALVKSQLTPAEGGISEPEELPTASESGWSGLVGLRYTLRLANSLSLAANGTYTRLSLDGTEAGVRRAAYWTWTLGIQLHPWGRDRKGGAS